MRSLLLTILYACSAPTSETPAPSPAAQTAPSTDEADKADEADEAASSPRLGDVNTTAHAADQVVARHILIAWRGALGARGVSRDREEALALAQELRARLLAGEDFARLARRWSNDMGTSRQGGSLGAFGRGEMQRAFEDAAFSLPVGALSEPVESPYGFHLIERLPLVEARLAHLLVPYQGLPRSKATRTREEALALVEGARARVLAGEPFSALAIELSESATGPWGGELGWLQKGVLSPKMDAAAFALAPGQLSPVLESSLGFHLFYRLE